MAKSNKSKKSESTELATLDSYVLATLDAATLAEIMEENLGGETLTVSDFDRIKVPSGGGLAWTVRDEDGDESPEKEIEGIIVYHHPASAYWKESLDESGGGTPPDAWSNDGITCYGDVGDGKTSRPVAECPMHQWGTGKGGKGKAAKETRVLYILMPGELLPTVLSVPPTSIKGFKKYLLRLVSKQVPLSGITTRFSLERAKNGSGIDYSKVVFDRGTAIPDDMRDKVRSYGSMIESLVSRMGSSAAVVAADEVGATEDAEPVAASSD